MSTATDTLADHRLWIGLHRDLRAAGWRHSQKWLDGGRDQDGAPWDDGYYEHVWKRGETEQITVYASVDTAEFGGSVSYWPDPEAGDPDGISISVGLAQERGPEWLRQAMELVGILPVTVWVMPEVPAHVRRFEDRYGCEWVRSSNDDLWTSGAGTIGAEPSWWLMAYRGPLTEVKS